MRLINTRTLSLAKAWALNAVRTLNISMDIVVLERDSHACLFGWQPGSVLGSLGTRLAIGIRPWQNRAAILMRTPDSDGSVLSSRWEGLIEDGEECLIRVMSDHLQGTKMLEKMKALLTP
jgi:hypothetical protein